MSADYSFYTTLCGFMPRPEGVQSKRLIINDYRSFLCLYYSFPFGIFRAKTARLRVQSTH